jgi:hypothetical protein
MAESIFSFRYDGNKKRTTGARHVKFGTATDRNLVYKFCTKLCFKDNSCNHGDGSKL